MNMTDERFLAGLRAELQSHSAVSRELSNGADISVLRVGSSVSDGAAIFKIGQSYILHLSPESFPNVAAEEVAAMWHAKETIGLQLSGPILDIVATGWFCGRSYFVVPFARAFSENRFYYAVQKRLARKEVFDWLRGLALISSNVVAGDVGVFLSNLDFLKHTMNGCAGIGEDIDVAMALLKNNEVKPSHIPMHSDLWIGNVMRKKNGELAIIDWGGFESRGYPLFDLVRFAESIGMTNSSLKAGIVEHLSILRQPPYAAPTLLLSGLGHIAQNLGEFPVKRFQILAETSVRQLTGAFN